MTKSQSDLWRLDPRDNWMFFGKMDGKLKQAFTLIEILVAISIIGILVGFGTVAFDNALEKGRDTKRKNDLTAVKAALTLYYYDHHQYPAPAGGESSSDSTQDTNWITELVSGDYINQLPVDPTQAGIIGNLAQLPKQFLKKENVKQVPQEGQVAALSTLYFGTFANTGTTGFEKDPKVGSGQICSPTITHCAGYMLRQKWARIEQTDDNFNWTYLDGAITALKDAGKKAMLRISAGPFSPDWLRTQKNIPTWCWYDDVGDAPEGNSYNCFPWILNDTYRAEIKELEQALYNHFTVERPDLGAAIAVVSILAPKHGKTPEFSVVQFPNNIIYQDPAVSGVPIGSYAETTPEVSQILALPTSRFTDQGYTNNALFTKLRGYIDDAYAAMPTWYIAVMHATSSDPNSTKGPSPISLVQNDYNHIINSGYLGRVAMGFTWLMPTTSPKFPQNQTVYNDVKQNFYEAHDGIVGWQYDPLGAPPADDVELEAWCDLAVPTGGKWGEAGENRWPSADLAAVAADPYCGQAPTPTPTPVPSPSPGIPPAPVLVSPADGATGVSTSPTLAWNASTGADTYRVQVTTDMVVACNTLWSTPVLSEDVTAPTTSYAVGGLSVNTQYRWKVRAQNTAGNSAWRCRSFTTGTSSPPPEPSSTPFPSSTPEASVTPAPTPSEGVSNYLYEIFDNGQSFVLWAKLENDNDAEISGHSAATCNETPPPGYNFCLKN